MEKPNKLKYRSRHYSQASGQVSKLSSFKGVVVTILAFMWKIIQLGMSSNLRI